MPANLSNNSVDVLKPSQPVSASVETQWRGRVLLLLINGLPVVHLLLMVGAFLTPWNWPGRIGLAFAALYLAPPLATRLVLLAIPIPEGRISLGSRHFFGWWTSFQLQVVFCRLPFLEEFLRLIPGLYSLWLRLWGSRIGRLTYWSAGTTVTDRSFLRVGDDVAFGAGVRLNAHVLAKNKEGRLELLLGTLKIGDRAMVGGYSLLTAGSEIAADEATRARLLSPPFSLWKGGKRIKNGQLDDNE